MKKKLLKSTIIATLTGLLSTNLYAEKLAPDEAEKKKRPVVQLAILLDTSGSMNGLIDQAKTQLWKVVNSFSKVEKNEQVPKVEVALYEYGNSRLSMQSHYIRQLSPLTEELDDISEKLFSLTTSGGEEYCGAVIQKSLNDLDWNESSDVYKAIFIAGNEPFTQGPVSSTENCQRAIREGIVVNTIHCGAESAGVRGGWKAGALAAEGDFLLIDQDRAVGHIPAPQDKIIIEISQKLNKTYIPVGRKGIAKQENQVAQDMNAQKEAKKGASINRALTKGGKNYCNTSWDLVDQCKESFEALNKVAKDELPEEMKGMSEEEMKTHVAKMQAKRKALQEQINTLNKEREAFLVKERAKLSENTGEDTLDLAMTKAIFRQVTKNGFNVVEAETLKR